MTYLQALADLRDDQMLVITLQDGESISSVRARIRRAAKAVGRHMQTQSDDPNTLLVRWAPSPSLANVLAEAFPTLVNSAPPNRECLISRIAAIKIDSFAYPEPFRHVALALDAVVRCGELEPLTRRFIQEHPVQRTHRREYDDQFISCLTEACALAWADLRGCHPIRYTSEVPGAPDLQAFDGLWIEAKAIGPSDAERQLLVDMLATKKVRVGTVQMPSDGLWRKFDYVFNDTRKKLDRQERKEGVLFLNLTTLDMASWPVTEEFFTEVRAWAERKRNEAPNIRIVFVYNYN